MRCSPRCARASISGSKSKRASWKALLNDYLSVRDSLQCCFLLIDSCIPAQKIDLEFVNKLGKMEIPLSLVFTKADKENQRIIQGNIGNFKKEMLKNWQFLPRQFITSVKTSDGKNEILDFIEEVNSKFPLVRHNIT